MRITLFTTVSLLALLAMTPAQAGFQFVPTTPTPTANAATAPNASSQADKTPVIANPTVSSEILPVDNGAPMQLGAKAIPLTPVVKKSDALAEDDATPSAMPTPAPVVAMPAPKKDNSDVLWDSGIRSPMKPVEEPKPVILSSDIKPADIKSEVAQSDLNDGPAIQGFGRKVPLALALQQIVPPNYRYSFDYGVDAGQRVSWTGGKPWKAVVTDLAQSNGMNVDIVNNVIAFHHRSPMEVVSAQSSVDLSKDTVQGMTLKPVPNDHVSTDMTVLPPLDGTTPAVTGSVPSPIAGDNKPMSLLKPYKADETLPARQPLASIGNEGISDLPPPVMTEKTTIIQPPKMADAQVGAKKPLSSTSFDPLLDDKAENKASNKKVANKKIDIADDSDLAPPVPLTSPAAAPAPVVGKTDNIIFDNTPSTASADTPDRLMKKLDEAKKTDKAMKQLITSDALTAPVPPLTPLPPVMTSSADTAPAIAPAVGSDLTTSQEWTGEKDATLRSVLTDWSQRSGVSLVWSSEYDYPLQTAVRVEGDYHDAVRTLLAGFSKAEPRPLGRLFKNKSIGGQPVLVVETQRLTH